MNIDDLLRAAVAKGASDLHLKVGAYPMMRVSRARWFRSPKRSASTTKTRVAMGAAVMSTEQREKFNETQEVDLAYSVGGPRPLPLQRLPAARHDGHGAARHPDQDSDGRRPAAAAGPRDRSPTRSAGWCS